MEVAQQRIALEPRRQGEVTGCDVSIVMPTTSWGGAFPACARRVLDLIEAAPIVAEFVVVHDGPMSEPPEWLRRPDVRLLATRRMGGPAAARNKAAEQARGAVLFFVDADVELAADSLDRVHAAFAADNAPVAVFGAYDNAPAAVGTVSQFRNLLHHHTHLSHPGRAGTFWAGCGAVRTAHFHDVGGFDEKYRYPSVEDIELGMRLEADGGRIDLDPLLQGKHHKRWTLKSMITTDIASRAVPWTRLIMNSRRLPATLNVDWKNRISGMLAVAGVLAMIAAAVTRFGLPVAIGCIAGVVALNRDFYLMCMRRRGMAFAAASCALHFLFFVYSSIAFGVVVLSSLVFGLGRPSCSSRPSLAPREDPVPAGSSAVVSTAVSRSA